MDTLKYYEALLLAGHNKAEAKAHVYAFNEAATTLSSKENLNDAVKILDAKMTIKFNLIERAGLAFFLVIVGLLINVAFMVAKLK